MDAGRRFWIGMAVVAAVEVAVALSPGIVIQPSWFPNYLASKAFVMLLVGLGLIEYVNLFAGGAHAGTQRDKGSLIMILIGIVTAFGAAFGMRSHGVGLLLGVAQYAGLFFIVCGISIREWAIRLLGHSFSINVEIHKGQHLVTSGPYAVVRHPSYTGSLLAFVGVPLAIGTWAGALVTLVIMLVVYSYRIKVEERALVDGFGKEYEKYRRRTWLLLPGW